MSRTAFTLRIEAEERNALKSLSKIEGRPINQLLIEAIQIYLGQRGRRERTLEANLKNLKDYRKKDPGFRRAIAAFVDAEASVNDALEGEPLEGDAENHAPTPAGPVQSKVRELIGA
jgi:ABC-type transport system substrate-binding protein